MTTDQVTIHTHAGDYEATAAQAAAVAVAARHFTNAGLEACVHPAECGCCVIVHAEAATEAEHAKVAGGYLIGRDGADPDEWITA